MTNLKIISVRVSLNDDYAEVTEITKGLTTHHKLGVSEDKETGLYEFYYEE